MPPLSIQQQSSESEDLSEDSEEESDDETESSSTETSSSEATPIKAKPQAVKASKAKPKKKVDDLHVETKDSSLLDLDDCEWAGPFPQWCHSFLILGEAPAVSQNNSVPIGSSDLLTPLSAGLEGLTLSDTKSASTSFQVFNITREPCWIIRTKWEN